MVSLSQSAPHTSAVFTGRNSLLDQYFYFAMSLLLAASVVWGFSHTIGQNLVHPAIPRPRILWFHGAVFSGWILFFIFQSALVRTRSIKWHRFFGWFGAGLGTVMVPLGLATAMTMIRFETYKLNEAGRYAFFIVPCYDVLSFGACFALAVLWRKKPEMHRRLILIAACSLCSAAFARFDPHLRMTGLFYSCVDGMIALGAIRDLLVNRRIHKVYLVALPSIMVAQSLVVYIWHTGPQWWVSFAHAVVG
jgi:hypothetical protein